MEKTDVVFRFGQSSNYKELIEANSDSAFVYSKVGDGDYRKFMSLESIDDYFYYFSIVNYMFLRGLIGLEEISDGNQMSFDKMKSIFNDPRFLEIDLGDREKLVTEYCEYVANNLLVVLEDVEVESGFIKKVQPTYYPDFHNFSCMAGSKSHAFFPLDISLLGTINRPEPTLETLEYDLSDKKTAKGESIGVMSFKGFESKEHETNGYITSALKAGESACLDYFRRSDDDLFLTYRELKSSEPHTVQLFDFW